MHLEAVCVFAAIGFFLDEDTYWKDLKVLKPASNHVFNDQDCLVSSKQWFNWHYSPRDISFENALDEFSDLFETIIKEQIQNKKVILPLSGGLDSRTQAAALHYLKTDVFSYSYQFERGYKEVNIAKKIAKACNFQFKDFTITEGYLWNKIDELSKLNQCYSDFTGPRQMAIHDEFDAMGEVFSLGHWGDVLFDSMNLPQLSKEEEVQVLTKKLLKRGGLEFAESLWKSWNLKSNFHSYFKNRIETLLDKINIEDTNAKLRAFKSLYWAPRWTSVNLRVFDDKKPITLPYYDNRMAQFICTVPEEYLKERKLQIAYIKKRSPELARIEWQDKRPFNLLNYEKNKMPYNLPYKLMNKSKRIVKSILRKPYVQRNWELQFLGEANNKQIVHYLFQNNLDSLLSKELINTVYDRFVNEDAIKNSHALNILLVLSKFNEAN